MSNTFLNTGGKLGTKQSSNLQLKERKRKMAKIVSESDGVTKNKIMV